jgi:TolB-like protein
VIDVAVRLRAALAGRYDVLRELGRGGMALVFLARDMKHDRPVAIKVLRPDLAAAIGAERFLREIEIAARLQHPHILPLYDSGEAGDLLYYVMPYVEGESLRDRLKREGPLPLADALAVARDVAAALTYAHARGVVHRDIKPENILLSGGQAIVADFGIARALRAAADERVTATGVAVGTPAYMSPEQVAGEAETDGRSDVYSLGVTVYEMLAGAPPFRGTARSLVLQHLSEPAPPLRAVRAGIPSSVERAVLRALEKSPTARYQTAAAFAEALAPAADVAAASRLRLLLWGAGAVVAVAGAALVGRHLSAPARVAPSGATIAVLPFDDLSGAQEDEYFSAGMSEELMTMLGRVPGLRVAPRTSASVLKARAADAREIGRELGVAYVLAGGVRAAGDRLRVTARLVSCTNGFQVWSEEYQADRRDVFAVQERISSAIVRSLRLHLVDTAQIVVQHRTDPATYDLYLKGRYFWDQRDQPGLTTAVKYFTQAVERDSLFAAAWSGLGDAYSMIGVFGYAPPRDVFPRARSAIARALALDPSSAEGHTSLGIVRLFYDWDWAGARRELDLGVGLDSSYSPARLFRAWYFVAVDSLPSALGEIQAAQVLDPLSLIIGTRVATMLALAGRFDDAVTQARRVLELDSAFLPAQVEVALDLAWSGKCEQALDVSRGLPVSKDSDNVMGTQAVAFASCAEPQAALDPLHHFEEERRRRYVSPFMIAPVYAALGDERRTFAWLDTAFADHTWYLVQLRQDPNYRPYRRDPRFASLLQRIGLSPVGRQDSR